MGEINPKYYYFCGFPMFLRVLVSSSSTFFSGHSHDSYLQNKYSKGLNVPWRAMNRIWMPLKNVFPERIKSWQIRKVFISKKIVFIGNMIMSVPQLYFSNLLGLLDCWDLMSKVLKMCLKKLQSDFFLIYFLFYFSCMKNVQLMDQSASFGDKRQ